jgi:hypothetical protein
MVAMMLVGLTLLGGARKADAAGSLEPQAISQAAWLAGGRAVVTPTVDAAEAAAFSVLRQPLTAADAMPSAESTSLSDSSVVGALGGNLSLARDAQAPNAVGTAWIVPGDGAVCMIPYGYATNGAGIGGGSCTDDAAATSGQLQTISGSVRAPGIALVSGLVPDGVSSVTLHLADGSTDVLSVNDNIYMGQVSQALASTTFTNTLTGQTATLPGMTLPTLANTVTNP